MRSRSKSALPLLAALLLLPSPALPARRPSGTALALSPAVQPVPAQPAVAALPAGAPAAPAGQPPAVVPPPPPPPEDPVQWPEPQRAFFQDGPQLLLTDFQRTALLHMDVGARQRWIDEFLSRAPNGTTPASALREAIERRQRLAAAKFVSPADVRAQLLFLDGTPAERTILDCGTTFKPIEVWTYKSGTEAASRSGSIVVYRPEPDEPFRAWTEPDGKRVLYEGEMENWLEQWEEHHGIGGGKRFDLRLCKQATLIDKVTGIGGLNGGRGGEGSEKVRHAYAQRPDGDDGEKLLDPPGDLARWARQAAATPGANQQALLAVPRLELQFPEWEGQRIVIRAIAQVIANGRIVEQGPGAESEPAPGGGATPKAPAPQGTKGATASPASPGAGSAEPAATPTATPEANAAATKQVVGITVEGAVENAGHIFESFRFRYRLQPPAAGQPVTIALDCPLRPRRPFVLRLKIRDDGNGAEAHVARGFVVPAQPITPPPAAVVASLPEGQEAQRQRLAGQQLEKLPPDTVALEPPEDDVVFGLWRAQALVTGTRITKVVFSVDNKPQYARNTPPYSVELRLKRLPTEQVVNADGYDIHGKLIASDRLVLNQPRGGLAVAIQQPARGSRAVGKTAATVEITVPSERRVELVEFRLNDQLVAKVTQPPWAATIDVPAEGDTVYLTVAAQLDDGTRAEDVRFLRSPDYVENLAVNVVELYTTVLDGAGQLVRGLTAGDFEVLESGQPQKLEKFELVENLPLTLGILIDTSGSMASSLGEAQRAAGGFLERMVRPGDRCFTLTFSDRPVLRMPLTDDPRAAARSLEKLQADGSTSIHDALVQSLFYFRGTRGQRALVLLSDGDDNTSQLTYDEALEYAKRSGVAIYTIGLNIPRHQVGIRGKLSRLGEATGGKVFYVSKAAELAGVYSEIEQELRSRYLLAFQSGVAAGAGGYRQIEVKMRQPNLKARTARGYYP
ncbi:MAG TPA: VWA domain-containing protein [Thermoanaerobaculia bacterium]|nr:VWA domain-containing protein [Thermoanaerobaculia bacterium]